MDATHGDISVELAPVFLQAGQSLHACQMLEYTLCLVLALVRDHAEPGGQAFQAAWDFHSSKTLGDLLKRLRKEVDAPSTLQEVLAAGVSARNRIVHGFMTSRAARLYEPQGRSAVIDELSRLRTLVIQADRTLEPLVDALLKKYGMSNAGLKTDAGRMWMLQNPADPSKH